MGSYGTERVILGRRAFLEPLRKKSWSFVAKIAHGVEEWKEFSTAIKEGREPLNNGNDGLKAVELAYAICQSAHSGNMVRLNEKMNGG